jgi:SHC-transforming protein 1
LYPTCSPALNGVREADRDYYNDLPGKVPPDIGPPPVPPLPNTASTLPNLKHHQNHASRTQAQNIAADSFSSTVDRQNLQWAGKTFFGRMIGPIYRM